MAKIKYIEHSGKEHVVDVQPGMTRHGGRREEHDPRHRRRLRTAPVHAQRATFTWTAPGSHKIEPMQEMEKTMLDFA
jgi:2Fe-2S ferredoxin